MDNYVTGKNIKELREKKKMTQAQLANIIEVSHKTISKWETGRGVPDIALIQPLAKALGVSIIEIMDGEHIVNNNVSGNMINSKFYACPICGNIIYTLGEALVSCCGITLPILEAELEDEKHKINCDIVENEYFISMKHSMTKSHYISFIAYVVGDRCELIKLYPEQNAEVRFLNRGKGIVYAYCNRDGLIKKFL